MERILLVEDDESLACGIEFALTRESWQVMHAKTVDEAKNLFNTSTYDIILLDVMLPDGNGFELCKAIRKTSNIPIIFLTACDEEVNVVLGLDIGADDYITKPFRVRELISRIRAVLRRKHGSTSTQHSACVIKSGDIALYLMERVLIKNGQEIMLTPIEFRLVNVFMSNSMQIMSRDKILEKLWDVEGEFIDDNTLSVYIRRLREKIEDKPSNPQYIVTVRGFGYKWNIPET